MSQNSVAILRNHEGMHNPLSDVRHIILRPATIFSTIEIENGFRKYDLV